MEQLHDKPKKEDLVHKIMTMAWKKPLQAQSPETSPNQKTNFDQRTSDINRNSSSSLKESNETHFSASNLSSYNKPQDDKRSRNYNSDIENTPPAETRFDARQSNTYFENTNRQVTRSISNNSNCESSYSDCDNHVNGSQLSNSCRTSESGMTNYTSLNRISKKTDFISQDSKPFFRKIHPRGANSRGFYIRPEEKGNYNFAKYADPKGDENERILEQSDLNPNVPSFAPHVSIMTNEMSDSKSETTEKPKRPGYSLYPLRKSLLRETDLQPTIRSQKIPAKLHEDLDSVLDAMDMVRLESLQTESTSALPSLPAADLTFGTASREKVKPRLAGVFKTSALPDTGIAHITNNSEVLPARNEFNSESTTASTQWMNDNFNSQPSNQTWLSHPQTRPTHESPMSAYPTEHISQPQIRPEDLSMSSMTPAAFAGNQSLTSATMAGHQTMASVSLTNHLQNSRPEDLSMSSMSPAAFAGNQSMISARMAGHQTMASVSLTGHLQNSRPEDLSMSSMTPAAFAGNQSMASVSLTGHLQSSRPVVTQVQPQPFVSGQMADNSFAYLQKAVSVASYQSQMRNATPPQSGCENFAMNTALPSMPPHSTESQLTGRDATLQPQSMGLNLQNGAEFGGNQLYDRGGGSRHAQMQNHPPSYSAAQYGVVESQVTGRGEILQPQCTNLMQMQHQNSVTPSSEFVIANQLYDKNMQMQNQNAVTPSSEFMVASQLYDKNVQMQQAAASTTEFSRNRMDTGSRVSSTGYMENQQLPVRFQDTNQMLDNKQRDVCENFTPAAVPYVTDFISNKVQPQTTRFRGDDFTQRFDVNVYQNTASSSTYSVDQSSCGHQEFASAANYAPSYAVPETCSTNNFQNVTAANQFQNSLPYSVDGVDHRQTFHQVETCFPASSYATEPSVSNQQNRLENNVVSASYPGNEMEKTQLGQQTFEQVQPCFPTSPYATEPSVSNQQNRFENNVVSASYPGNEMEKTQLGQQTFEQVQPCFPTSPYETEPCVSNQQNRFKNSMASAGYAGNEIDKAQLEQQTFEQVQTCPAVPSYSNEPYISNENHFQYSMPGSGQNTYSPPRNTVSVTYSQEFMANKMVSQQQLSEDCDNFTVNQKPYQKTATGGGGFVQQRINRVRTLHAAMPVAFPPAFTEQEEDSHELHSGSGVNGAIGRMRSPVPSLGSYGPSENLVPQQRLNDRQSYTVPQFVPTRPPPPIESRENADIQNDKPLNLSATPYTPTINRMENQSPQNRHERQQCNYIGQEVFVDQTMNGNGRQQEGRHSEEWSNRSRGDGSDSMTIQVSDDLLSPNQLTGLIPPSNYRKNSFNWNSRQANKFNFCQTELPNEKLSSTYSVPPQNDSNQYGYSKPHFVGILKRARPGPSEEERIGFYDGSRPPQESVKPSPVVIEPQKKVSFYGLGNGKFTSID